MDMEMGASIVMVLESGLLAQPCFLGEVEVDGKRLDFSNDIQRCVDAINASGGGSKPYQPHPTPQKEHVEVVVWTNGDSTLLSVQRVDASDHSEPVHRTPFRLVKQSPDPNKLLWLETLTASKEDRRILEGIGV